MTGGFAAERLFRNDPGAFSFATAAYVRYGSHRPSGAPTVETKMARVLFSPVVVIMAEYHRSSPEDVSMHRSDYMYCTPYGCMFSTYIRVGWLTLHSNSAATARRWRSE
jgi:hypothetical protein